LEAALANCFSHGAGAVYEGPLRRAVSLAERAKELEKRGRKREAALLAARARAMLESVVESKTATRREKMLAASYLEALNSRGNGRGGGLEYDGGAREEGLDEYVARARGFVARAEVSFDDVVGLDDVKERIIGALYYGLAEYEGGARVEVPARILLYGPPGTGKTLLAAAASNELGATFIEVPVSGILSKYVGDSPKMVSAVFRVAREEAPSVVFFDEVDALAVSRNLERQPATGLVQAFLQELDGVRGKGSRGPPVIVMAATNKPWILDDAFLRRFDAHIYVPPPDREARKGIILVHTVKRGVPLADDVDLDWLADSTEGYSGSDLKRLAAEATWRMLRRANPRPSRKTLLKVVAQGSRPRLRVEPITRGDFEEALRVVKPSVSPRVLELYEVWRRERGG